MQYNVLSNFFRLLHFVRNGRISSLRRGTTKQSRFCINIADDISNFGDDTALEDAKLKASTCAMQYAIDGSNGDCTITSNGDIIFTQSGVTYESIDVMYNAQTFENLIRDINGTKATVITNGYCATNDFTTRVEDKNATTYDPATYHVCPITETADAEELTTEALIVDALNDGVESIGGIATEDMQADIDEFKCEVLGGTYNGSCSVSLDQNVTNTQVIDYLNNNN